MDLIRIDPTSVLLSGDKKSAEAYIGPAKSQMEILKNAMSFRGLKTGVRKIWLDENTYIECVKCYHIQECLIWKRPQPALRKKSNIVYGFILVVTDQTGDEAFAWDLINNRLYKKEDGDPLLVNEEGEEIKVAPFDEIIVALTEVLSQIDTMKDIDNSELDPQQFQISGVVYDSWWDCALEDTPCCEEYSGNPDIDEYNALPVVWPDYYKIDYSYAEVYPQQRLPSGEFYDTWEEGADCICQANSKISKMHHPAYYLGVTPGQDPAFDYFNASDTAPLFTLFGSGGVNAPWAEWMCPYIEYTNHETKKREDPESAGVIRKSGQYLPSSVPDTIKSRCGVIPDPEPASYERIFYWFSSIFGASLRTYEDPVYGEVYLPSTQSNLDYLADILFNSWDDDCHVRYTLPEGQGCSATTFPLSDFGIAQNELGAAVFDFCVTAWGYDSATLTEDQKYRGAISGEYSQIFRLYTHPCDHIGGLARAIFYAHNIVRDREGLDRFSVNRHLTEAAKRHATDLAENQMTGHTGSDGSSYDERINDTDYFLWENNNWWTGENINHIDLRENDIVQICMDEWENSPPHWANMISENYDEIGVATAYGTLHYDAEDIDVVVIVVCFGNIEGKWAGFGQVDTTDLLSHINEHFLWSGDDNNRRVPKLYLV